MTSKERMMRALHREKPDRLPVTIHEWQPYHLKTFMNGMDSLSAFKATGLDADVATMGQSLILDTSQTPLWQETTEVISDNPENRILCHTITTPDGILTYKTGADSITTWVLEYPIKNHNDVYIIEKFMPVPKLNKQRIAGEYDAVGDAGILRGFVWGDQPGCWQHACCLMNPQRLIIEAIDNPDWVHQLLRILLNKKLQFISESLGGAKFDLIETGGGAGSDTLISPAMHREFCLPYDQRIHDALHASGHMSTYHTCGGMMNILDLIIQNKTDASETLSPPGTGGNIHQPQKVKEAFAGKVAMIGGMDQVNLLTMGTKEQIRTEVNRLFNGFGKDGGYILSASDHFFEAPVENLKAYATAARECIY